MVAGDRESEKLTAQVPTTSQWLSWDLKPKAIVLLCYQAALYSIFKDEYVFASQQEEAGHRRQKEQYVWKSAGRVRPPEEEQVSS